MGSLSRMTVRATAVLVTALACLAAPGALWPSDVAYAAPSPDPSALFGIAAAPSGDFYATVPEAHRVERYSASGGLVGSWGTEGSGAGQFSFPKGIAVAANGTVYVVDGSNGRVQFFTPEGGFLGQWGAVGDADGQFFGPESVAVASDGTVYVADYGNYRVQYFTPEGEFLGKWGAQGAGAGEFNLPMGIAVDRQGTVFVSDLYNKRIQRFASDGSYLGEWDTLPNTSNASDEAPHGLSVGPDGTVYCANYFEGRIERYASTGELLDVVDVSASGQELATPQSVALATDGTLFLAGTEQVRVATALPQDPVGVLEVIVPSDIVVEAADASGTVVTFEVTAVGADGETVDAVASPVSGSLFPVGDTTVVVTAQDASGNVATKEFMVRVLPPPVVPSAEPTESEEATPAVPDASDDATGFGFLKSPYVWGSLIAAVAFVTSRRKRFMLMLGIGGLLVALWLVT